MKQAIKERWLAALRSGQYRQCTGKLTDGAGFCCLGVLTNLYALETGEMWERRRDGIGFDGETSALPIKVRAWAGLETGNPRTPEECNIGGRYHGSSLAEWNDGGGDFREIADIIQRNF